MTSPVCTVKDGAGSPQTTTAAYATVTPANTVTIALADTTGVSTWSISCVYTDETSDAATVTAALTVLSGPKTASFTAPASGKAYIFRSVVNSGVDSNGTTQASYTTTFKVATLTSQGYVVAAINETTEHNSSYGWMPIVNTLVRNPPSGVNAYTVTTNSFTAPAINSNVAVPVSNTSWMAVGEVIYISTAGYYQVATLTDSTHVSAKNLGYTGNATSTTVISTAQSVVAGGLVGPTGATGTTGAAGVGATYDTFANLPAAPAAGNIYIPSDGYTNWVSDGSAWRPQVLRGVVGTRPPLVASWTSFGSLGTTNTDSFGTVRLVSATNATTQVNGLDRTKNATMTVTAFLAINPTLIAASGGSEGGLIVRDSGAGNATVFDMTWTNTAGMILECFRCNLSSGRTVSTGVVNKTVNFAPLPYGGVFLRFQDDATNHIYSYSMDGRNFVSFYSEVRAAYVPSGGNRIGVSLASSTAITCDMTLFSWLEV